MAIVKLKKICLCGLSADKQTVLEDLQRFGGLHLITTQPPNQPGQADAQSGGSSYRALQYLLAGSNIRHQVRHIDNFDVDDVVKKVHAVKSQLRDLTDQRDFLHKRIKEIEPWGDFTLPPSGQLGNLKFWFYIVPNRLMKKVPVDGWVWQVVHKDNLNCYVVVISKTEPDPNVMPVVRTHTGKISLAELQKQLNAVELKLEDAQAERESLTRWITMISQHLAEIEDREFLQQALDGTLDQYGVFAVQAWLPETLLNEVSDFSSEHELLMQSQDPEPGDKPPTLLSNTPLPAGGQDVVLFYQTPNYYDWDPSGVVFFSFSVFFAMILSDAGYAALFGLVLAVKWQAMGNSVKGRRFRALSLSTVVMAILWGMLVGSYFGYNPPDNSLLAWFKVLDMQDFDVMMRISISLGVAHLILANLIKAWQHRNNQQMFAPLAWILLASGGYLLWLALPLGQEMLVIMAQGMMVIAVLMLLLFSSDRAVKKPMDLIRRFIDGLVRLTGISKLFGDVLSYMRLFALGLASASLAMTFNDLAVHAIHDEEGLGLLSGLLILIIGHGLNLMLCLMSGVVHGLRLNFIEFYNWSVSDEGYAFKAFAKKGFCNE